MIMLISSVRFWRQHPWQLLLALVGVALGVALVVAVDGAARLANQSLAQSMQTLSGNATHQLIGYGRALDETVYVDLKKRLPNVSMRPVVTGDLWFATEKITLLGLDLLQPQQNPVTRSTTLQGDWRRLLTEPGSVVLTQASAGQLGVKINQTLSLQYRGAPVTLTVVGVLQVADPVLRDVLRNVLLTDIAVAQAQLQQVGRLTRVDLQLDAAQLLRVRAALPSTAQLIRTQTRIAQLTGTAQAFQLNLKALSLLALIVGLFLIYNTFTFTVLQRRQLIGVYRAIGVTRGEIFRYLLLEAAMLGLIGAAIGLGLSYVLLHVLVGFVEQSINDLYFSVLIQHISIDLPQIIKGVLLGVAAAVLATMMPAYEATTTSPRMAAQKIDIEQKLLRHLPALNALALCLMALGGALLLVVDKHLGLTFASLFCLVLGFACWMPWLIKLQLKGLRCLVEPLAYFTPRMAVRSLRVSLARTAIAIAALAIAIASASAMGLMIHSFRATVTDWLGDFLQADIYLSPVGASLQPSTATLTPAQLDLVRRTPGVAAVSFGRNVQLESASGLTMLMVSDLPPAGFAAFDLIAGEQQRAKQAFYQGRGVLISEPYAHHHTVGVGDVLTLPAPIPLRLPIVGVYRDYGSEQGEVLLHRNQYVAHWQDPSITSIGVYLQPGVALDTMMQRLDTLTQTEHWAVNITPTQEIIQLSLSIFDRTFAITQVLRALTVVVAFVGVMSAVMAIQLERAKEMAVLRAVGLSRVQLGALVLSECSLIGLLAGVLAIPLGGGLGYLLVTVVNQRSFGWSMDFLWRSSDVLQGFALAILAAFLAGLYPAWKMAHADIATALRNE